MTVLNHLIILIGDILYILWILQLRTEYRKSDIVGMSAFSLVHVIRAVLLQMTGLDVSSNCTQYSLTVLKVTKVD